MVKKFSLLGEVPEVEGEAENLPPGSRTGLTGPESGWRRGVHQHWRRVNHRANSSKYSLWTLSFFILLSIPISCLWPNSSNLISFLFFCRGCANYARPATCSRRWSTCNRKQSTWKPKVLKIECVVAWLKANHDILQVAMTLPEPSTRPWGYSLRPVSSGA